MSDLRPDAGSDTGAESRNQDKSIVLAQVEKSYWLLEGEPHLYAMLAAQGAYPIPVWCVRFSSVIELNALLPEDRSLSSLWSVHPAVIERLRRNDEMIVLDSSELD